MESEGMVCFEIFKTAILDTMFFKNPIFSEMFVNDTVNVPDCLYPNTATIKDMTRLLYNWEIELNTRYMNIKYPGKLAPSEQLKMAAFVEFETFIYSNLIVCRIPINGHITNIVWDMNTNNVTKNGEHLY